MNEQLKSRLVGLLIIAIGVGLTAWNWYNAFNNGYYYLKASFFGPFLVPPGFHMVLFAPPLGDKKLDLFKIAFLIFGLLAGGVNAYLMSNLR